LTHVLLQSIPPPGARFTREGKDHEKNRFFSRSTFELLKKTDGKSIHPPPLARSLVVDPSPRRYCTLQLVGNR
jgi:hypothetical protein